MQASNVFVFTDGACEPKNPGGIATAGMVIMKRGDVIHEEGWFVTEGYIATNNVAEYAALAGAMRWLINHGETGKVTFVSDSKLVVGQMNGTMVAREGVYIEHYREAATLAKQFEMATFKWVIRNLNSRADAWSRKAYETRCNEKGIPAIYFNKTKKSSKTVARTGSSNSCITCKWMKERGPHVGCYLHGKYRAWIPGNVARSGPCPVNMHVTLDDDGNQHGNDGY